MKIITQSHEILQPRIEKLRDELIMIESTTRVAYKSENAITPESAGPFVTKLKNTQHLAALEFGMLTVKFITNRGVTHEIVRHREFSYMQECVTGDTRVHPHYTIEELYNMKQRGPTYWNQYKQMLKLPCVNDDGLIIKSGMNDVMYNGVKTVYEVRTSLGYTIKCTKKHQFNTPTGFIELSNLKIGDRVYVNGRPCLIPLNKEEMVKMYLADGKNPTEIAEEFGVRYECVLNYLKRLGIFSPRLNDKNSEKYTKNHTRDSYEKMRRTIIDQYRNGRTVWNAGLSAEDDPRQKKIIDNLLKHKHSNGYGVNNSNYIDGRSSYKRLKSDVVSCEICGSTEHLEVHHIDRDRSNNDIGNLVKLCRKCHNMQHSGFSIGKYLILDTITSVKKIGEQRVFDISMADPYHNYIANGFSVHNSSRWCLYTKDKFGNEITVIKPSTFDTWPVAAKEVWTRAMNEAEASYKSLVANGLPAERARGVLPNDLKTEIVMKGNFRRWMHFFDLRCVGKAGRPHPDMLDLVTPLYLHLRDELPEVFDLGEPMTKMS